MDDLGERRQRRCTRLPWVRRLGEMADQQLPRVWTIGGQRSLRSRSVDPLLHLLWAGALSPTSSSNPAGLHTPASAAIEARHVFDDIPTRCHTCFRNRKSWTF